jgi:hypothetical protein
VLGVSMPHHEIAPKYSRSLKCREIVELAKFWKQKLGGWHSLYDAVSQPASPIPLAVETVRPDFFRCQIGLCTTSIEFISNSSGRGDFWFNTGDVELGTNLSFFQNLITL